MFSAMRATIVVSQPPRLSTSQAPARLTRSHVSLDGVVGLRQRAKQNV
jgi:hypothetical protein